MKSLVPKYWPMILLVVLIAAVLCLSRYAEIRKVHHRENVQLSCSEDPTFPPVPAPKLLETFTWPEGVTAWALILTLFVIAWQAAETHAAARATEAAVEHSRDTAKLELRAYLSVVIGDAIYQQRRSVEDGGDLMFDCRPLLINTGRTPAARIRFKTRAAILPFPLSKDINLPEELDENVGDSILGSQQNANMFAMVDGYQADSDVDEIKTGCGKRALFVWGRVTYEDIFGGRHTTRFCQQIYWDRKNNVRGNYIPGRNEAD